MKNIIKLSFITALFSILAISGSVFPNYVIGESNSSATKKIYQQNCARCHGLDGKGTGELGRSLDVPDLTQMGLSTAKIASVVRNGMGSMPGFKKKLNAKQIASVSSYTKSLK
jgi:mono/diheme cytochrome c family protein